MKRNTHRRFANFMELQQPWTLHWILSKKARNIYLAKGIRRKIIIKRPEECFMCSQTPQVDPVQHNQASHVIWTLCYIVQKAICEWRKSQIYQLLTRRQRRQKEKKKTNHLPSECQTAEALWLSDDKVAVSDAKCATGRWQLSQHMTKWNEREREDPPEENTPNGQTLTESLFFVNCVRLIYLSSVVTGAQ